MKRAYEKPLMMVEEFVAKQRIAACEVNIVGDWNKVSFRCEAYTTGDDSTASCSGGSQHNDALSNLNKYITDNYNPFANSTSCRKVVDSVSGLLPLIAQAANEIPGGAGGWQVQQINKGGKVTTIARNPSGEHVLDIQGFNLYEDAFTS